MREPLFLEDLDTFGEKVWIEVEGYDRMIQRPVGRMMGVEKEILGWSVETLGDIFEKRKEANYAPRVRYWRGEDMPTVEERAAGAWDNLDRLWFPSVPGGETKEQMAEFEETGRTVWPLPPVPDDPVKFNAELAALGGEPLAPRCASCHWGKWKDNTKRWYEHNITKEPRFLPCVNIGTNGWKWWNEHQTEPPTCKGYCKIGEYKPHGVWAQMAGVMQEILKIPVGGREDGQENED